MVEELLSTSCSKRSERSLRDTVTVTDKAHNKEATRATKKRKEKTIRRRYDVKETQTHKETHSSGNGAERERQGTCACVSTVWLVCQRRRGSGRGRGEGRGRNQRVRCSGEGKGPVSALSGLDQTHSPGAPTPSLCDQTLRGRPSVRDLGNPHFFFWQQTPFIHEQSVFL